MRSAFRVPRSAIAFGGLKPTSQGNRYAAALLEPRPFRGEAATRNAERGTRNEHEKRSCR
jgi:hypothetical protein